MRGFWPGSWSACPTSRPRTGNVTFGKLKHLHDRARIGEDRAEVDGAQAHRLGGHDHVLRGQERILKGREEQVDRPKASEEIPRSARMRLLRYRSATKMNRSPFVPPT